MWLSKLSISHVMSCVCQLILKNKMKWKLTYFKQLKIFSVLRRFMCGGDRHCPVGHWFAVFFHDTGSEQRSASRLLSHPASGFRVHVTKMLVVNGRRLRTSTSGIVGVADWTWAGSTCCADRLHIWDVHAGAGCPTHDGRCCRCHRKTRCRRPHWNYERNIRQSHRLLAKLR